MCVMHRRVTATRGRWVVVGRRCAQVLGKRPRSQRVLPGCPRLAAVGGMARVSGNQPLTAATDSGRGPTTHSQAEISSQGSCGGDLLAHPSPQPCGERGGLTREAGALPSELGGGDAALDTQDSHSPWHSPRHPHLRPKVGGRP